MKKENLIKFYSDHRSYIFPAVVALSSLFLIVFVIYPQAVKLINNQRAIGDLMNKSKFLETKVTALESYNEEDLSRKLKFALATLPADKDFGNILGLLQQLTVQSGFAIDSISFGSTASKSGNSDSFDVKLEIRGAKGSFQTLLNSLEDSRRLMRINSIDISSSQASQTLNVALVAEVLYSQLPQSFGGVDSPLPELSQKEEQLIVKLARFGETVSSPSATQSLPRGKSNPFE